MRYIKIMKKRGENLQFQGHGGKQKKKMAFEVVLRYTNLKKATVMK